jgi:hypothetical protein
MSTRDGVHAATQTAVVALASSAVAATLPFGDMPTRMMLGNLAGQMVSSLFQHRITNPFARPEVTIHSHTEFGEGNPYFAVLEQHIAAHLTALPHASELVSQDSDVFLRPTDMRNRSVPIDWDGQTFLLRHGGAGTILLQAQRGDTPPETVKNLVRHLQERGANAHTRLLRLWTIRKSGGGGQAQARRWCGGAPRV